MFLGNNIYSRRLWYTCIRNFGGKERAIKKRAQTVAIIEKVTKTMKLMAQAQMRGEHDLLNSGKFFGQDSVETIFKTDLYMQRKMPSEVENPKTLIVPLSTDKGLCGGINSLMVREVTHYIGKNKTDSFKLLCVGDKGASALRRQYPKIANHAITKIYYIFAISILN